MKAFNLLAGIAVIGILASCGSNQGTGVAVNPYTSTTAPGYVPGVQTAGHGVTTLLGGMYYIGYSTTFTSTFQVYPGDQIVANFAGAKYGIASAYCGQGIIQGQVQSSLDGDLTNIRVMIGGTEVANGNGGSYTVPAGSQSPTTLTVTGTLTPTERKCGFPYSGSATVSYWVNFGAGLQVSR